MLSLRVLRGSSATALLPWLLVALASCGTGLLLLASLGWALAHPGGSTADAVVRLGWCVLPVAVTVQLAVAVGGAQPAAWPRSGLAAAGLGRTGVVLLSATSAAAVCGAGSAAALLLFLELRGDITGRGLLRRGPRSARLRTPAAAGRGGDAAGPGAGGGRSGERRPAADLPGAVRRHAGGLPWGVALVAVGLAIEVSARHGDTVPLPSGLGAIPTASAGGWIVTTAGLTLAGPGLVHLSGRLVAAVRPGAVRLLAGRGLQQEARRLGHPLGLLAATSAAAFCGYGLRRDAGHPLGPVTTFAATLVAVCVLASTATAAAGSRRDRAPVGAALGELAASPTLLRTAATVRGAALVAAFLPPAVLIAAVSPLP